MDISRKPRILLGVSGSVAAVKGPELAVQLVQQGADVRVLLTIGGENFWSKGKSYNPQAWDALENVVGSYNEEVEYLSSMENRKAEPVGSVIVHEAEDEWKSWNTLGDPVLHIDLRNWADLIVIAPLSAHTMAKIACGLCDDPLTCVMRAWDYGHGNRTGKPVVLAPAMNTAMWEHPLTTSQLNTIRAFWNDEKGRNQVHIVKPRVSTLACGEVGAGAMADLCSIVDVIKQCLRNHDI